MPKKNEKLYLHSVLKGERVSMSVSSMVHRSAGGSPTVRNAVSDDALSEPSADVPDAGEDAAERPARDPIGIVVDEQTKELPDCKVRRNYTCSACDFFTQNPRLFLYHLRDVHHERIRVYECPNCLYASKHFQKLLRHSKMVHGTSEGMSAAETSRKSRKRSIEDDDEDGPATVPSFDDQVLEEPVEEDPVEDDPDRSPTFKCSVCAFVSKSRVLLSRHEREEHIKTKFFRCSKCTYVTHIKARYTKHVKYHSMPMIKCDMCDFRTPYKWNLDRHCKNHNGKGAFRCSACNFTADIKQSLTVHEMNHHVPPVGQAAGLGVGRRRNKVGASDTTAAEENAASSQDPSLVVPQPEPVPFAEQLLQEEHHQPKPKPKIKITPKKTKVAPAKLSDGRTGSRHSDFIHPDDIIHHANGNVYIKNKCKLCNFKTAWDSEMAKHERKFHNLDREITERGATRKTARPIPNLIPIPSASSGKHRLPNFRSAEIPEPKELAMSEKDMNDICRRSMNSALKDLASLFSSEDVFKNASMAKVPDLIPASVFNSAGGKTKPRNSSFFDKFGPELGSRSNLICNLCGYESKCLTEQVKHQKICGKETNKVPNIIPVHNISASRCQYCRHRCKSSADLHVHLQTCAEAQRMYSDEIKQEDDTLSENENDLKIDEDRQSADGEYDSKPHPMENKVFVWNNIMVPMDIEVDDSSYEYTEDKNDDNMSLDLSMWSQSPACSDNSSAGQENNNNISASVHHSPLPTTEKIPTHGNDISVAQHKRVFKCPHCTFWASTASRFHVHIVGHLNKKPFECSLCSYRSNWRWDITKHIKLKSVRDQAHEQAKVLMTDETGRRNYSKYNKYLTEIPLSSLQSSSETSGGSGTRPKNYDRNSSPSTSKTDRTKMISTGDLNSLLKVGNLKPPPPGLKAVDRHFLNSLSLEKKKINADSKRTLFKCKKCNFRDASRDVLLQHVKAHYQQPLDPQELYQQAVAAAQVTVTPSLLASAAAAAAGTSGSALFTSQDLSLRGTSPDRDEASVNNSNVTKGGTATQAPFRCGHCNQVSNWKHVIQRHCRLKHNGDIRVVSSKNGQEKMEIEEQTDEPDYNDAPQWGTFKCSMCPYSTDNSDEYQAHQPGHKPHTDNTVKCFFCKFWVALEDDLLDHLKLHGVSDPQEFVRNNASDPEGKKFKCMLCPYVTNTKSQYNYHKQFHKNRGGQYTCSQCSYNVSKRHLLHQHLKIHGINVSPSKQNGEGIDFDDINVEIEEVPCNSATLNTSDYTDIPLVWVSKDGQFSKMFKCRFCPHVNLRKVNIQEHEKMHSPRDKSSNASSKPSDMEHRCVECNYICKNAGVLSSHSKVHQGLYGTIHSIVDLTRSDEEQLREISRDINSASEGIDTSEFLQVEMEEPEATSDGVLYFCSDCPARFLKRTEHKIHRSFHDSSSHRYKCDSCSYSSDNDSYLTSHMKVHTTEYHNRTEKLKEFNMTSSDHPEPELKEAIISNGDSVWEVVYKSEIERKNNILASFLSMPLKSSQQNVPISGTDLFQRRSEAQHVLECIEREELPVEEDEVGPSRSPVDISVQGNPEFVYQKCVKNGRVKEKRYKCHKCPSAFEKREQYKIHLGLHGSRQRYNCEHCDYSVTYFANYAQHLKKHKFNEDAQAALKKSLDAIDDNDEADESMEVVKDAAATTPDNCDDGSLKLSVADQQMLNIMERRKSNSNSPVDEKKSYYCSHCPYVNGRRDALDNHLKRHECVSKLKSAYACEYCDYSVPQAHFLRDHTKLHFIPNKSNHVDGYMICDNFKLTSSKASNVKEDDEELVIYENETKDDPSTTKENEEEEEEEKFNNNKGETELPDVQTGDLSVEQSSELNS